MASPDPPRHVASRMIRLLAALAFVFAPTGRASETLSIAAASDLVFCLEALNREFAKSEPSVSLRVSTGSSGNFFAQIKNGAPFDVFLSADLIYPIKLIAAGAAEEKSLTRYGIGRIVLWTRRTDLAIDDLASVVRDPGVKRFAIANPDHAPYGRAAKEALDKFGAWAEVRPKLVLGENIAQTAQFVQTGNADVGIVALSLVIAPVLKRSGRWMEIPSSAHAPLEQGAVLTRRGASNPAARRYLAFLSTPAARTIFDRYGFSLPRSP